MGKLIQVLPTILIGTFSLTSATQAQEPVNPVGFTLSCTIPAGQLTCSAQVSLPAGKRIVLENVSAKASAPSGQTVQLHVATSSPNLPSGTIVARNFVAFNPSANGTVYFANNSIRMYGTTGSYVSIIGQRISPLGSSGDVRYEAWFSGYLLP